MGFELNILDWFQTLHTPMMDKLMTSVTKLGDAGIFWIILTLIFLIIPKMRKTGVTMAAALIVDLLLCNVLLKNLVARTRPYDVNTTVELLVAKLRDYSFPSGHTAASFASVTALYLSGERRIWIIALVISCLIAVSRLYLYVHYPTDVLGGIISPMDGIGPADIEIDSLVKRVAEGGVREVILALSSTMEGDTTNFYISRKLAPYDVELSVIARGISVGDELEYTDEVTLGRAIINRTKMTGK